MLLRGKLAIVEGRSSSFTCYQPCSVAHLSQHCRYLKHRLFKTQKEVNHAIAKIRAPDFSSPICQLIEQREIKTNCHPVFFNSTQNGALTPLILWIRLKAVGCQIASLCGDVD